MRKRILSAGLAAALLAIAPAQAQVCVASGCTARVAGESAYQLYVDGVNSANTTNGTTNTPLTQALWLQSLVGAQGSGGLPGLAAATSTACPANTSTSGTLPLVAPTTGGSCQSVTASGTLSIAAPVTASGTANTAQLVQLWVYPNGQTVTLPAASGTLTWLNSTGAAPAVGTGPVLMNLESRDGFATMFASTGP